MTHVLAAAMRAVLAKHADSAKAPRMQRYMKSAMPYYGVSAPVQHRLWREVSREHPVGSCEELRRVALELWRDARYREERYAAIGLADLPRYRACQTLDALPMYEEMIVTGAWWDYVDFLATHHLGNVLRSEPARMKRLMRRWARDRDLWKRRAAILCQIRFKADTDVDLLYACIEPSLDDNDFFIRKAIGWALREVAKRDPDWVRSFVADRGGVLSGLSQREALKNIGPGPE